MLRQHEVGDILIPLPLWQGSIRKPFEPDTLCAGQQNSCTNGSTGLPYLSLTVQALPLFIATL
ncbi:MAG: hypothetical protein DRI61_11475 [Chloroflexi bacterium]|nr:MAG: hypothetical protein DRI61_11475 [Chloroflexota bacterium]